MRPRVDRTLLLATALLLALVVGLSEARAQQGEELKSPDRLRSGSTPELRERYMRGLAKASPDVRPHIADQVLHNIVILVDDGTLIQNNTTNTDNIAARFYSLHGDDWDFLNVNVASSFNPDTEPEGGFAFEQNISNSVTGINLGIFNFGASVAPGVTRLQSILNMNDLGEYGEDPAEILPGFLNSNSGIDILCQEAGHRMGAFVTANNADILGRAAAHWSYFFQSYGSTLEGNEWRDNGNGTFTTVASADRISQLDNYLWGFITAAQVTDPMYVITNPVPNLAANGGDAALPTVGVTVAGTPVTVTMANITAVHGVRSPDPTTSQKNFTMAWILVIPAGMTAPEPHDLEKIDDFRWQWEEAFAAETQGIGSMSSQFVADPVIADFEAHTVEGEVGHTVQFDNDSFGSITSFLWDFGDGNTSTERHPTHTYNTAGEFDVSLTVSGTGGPVVETKTAFIRIGPTTTLFEDDFETDQGWTNDGSDTATTGVWLRAVPVPSFVSSVYGNDTVQQIVQPGTDSSPNGTHCLVTGNAPSQTSSIGVNDVDGGVTTMVSPVIDLSSATDPVLSFQHWFTNNSGSSGGRDDLRCDVSSDSGATWVNVLTFKSSHHFWREEQVRLTDFVSLTADMRVRFQTEDLNDGSLVEAAVDDVRIFETDTATDVADFAAGSRFALDRCHPNPFVERTTIRYAVPAPGATIQLDIYGVDGRRVRSVASGFKTPGVHSVRWDGRDSSGREVATGIYLYRLRTPDGPIARKVFFVR